MAITYVHPRVVEQQVCLCSSARKMCVCTYIRTYILCIHTHIKHAHIHTDVYMVDSKVGSDCPLFLI